MFFNRIVDFLGVEKKVIKDYTFYVFSNASSVLIPLLITPFLIRSYSIETFGLISFQQILMLFFALLFDNGIRLYVIRELSVNRENTQELQRVFNVFMNYKIIICLSISLLYILYVIFFVSPAIYTVTLTSLLIFYGAMLSPAFLFVALEDFQKVSLINSLSRVIYIVLVFLLINKNVPAFWVNSFLGISLLFTNIIYFIQLKVQYEIRFHLEFNFSNASKLMKQSSGLVWNNFFQNAEVYLHNLLVGILANKYELGVFSAIEKFFSIFKQALISLIEVLYPKVCLEVNNPVKNYWRVLNKIAYFVAFGFIILYAVIWTFNKEIAFYLTRESSDLPQKLLLTFMIIPFFILFFNFSSHLMIMAANNDRVLSRITLVVLLVKLFTIFLFYKFLGLYGIVLSLIFSEVIAGILKHRATRMVDEQTF